jgi:DNA-binding NtrC family response regulator
MPRTLLVTGVDSLAPEKQKILQTLMTGRDVFLPFARRFRLVLAADRHLSDLADAGRFNDTLFYKISSLSVEVPTLRALRGDILLHARHLIDHHAAAHRVEKSPSLSPAAATWLEEQEWPGNYAELSRTLQLAVASSKHPELSVPVLEFALEKILAETGPSTGSASPWPSAGSSARRGRSTSMRSPPTGACRRAGARSRHCSQSAS